MNPEKERYTSRTVRRGAGITVKLLMAVVASIIIAVGALLIVVYNQMSHALLEKNDEILHTTTDRAIQETKAWMNKVLVSLNMQRDTIEYENMNTKEIKEYIKYTAGQNEAYPAGMYVALTDGSLYHASFVPEPGFNVLSRSWYQDGVESEEFILGDVYLDENSQSYVVGAFGVLKRQLHFPGLNLLLCILIYSTFNLTQLFPKDIIVLMPDNSVCMHVY